MRDETRIVLNKKIDEIKKDFEKWIRERNVLLFGEVAVIDIRIERSPAVITKISEQKKVRKLTYSNREMQQGDWNKVLSVPFSARELAILEMIRQNNNQPTSREKMRSELLKRFGRKYSEIYKGALNVKFSTRDLPYRLNECGNSCVKFFIIEEY